MDESDYAWLMQWKWYAQYEKNTESFYAGRAEKGTDGRYFLVAMHRAVLGLGSEDERLGDHINRNTLDNRKRNLRIATIAENNRNSAKNKNNTSGYKGVCWHKCHQKWGASISFENRKIHLGYFSDILEAKAAYESAALEYHKDFARFG